MEKTDIKSYNLEELTRDILEMGFPKFRAEQIYKRLFEKLAVSFDEMTELPKAMIEKLNEKYFINVPEIADKLVSKIDGTEKYLLKLFDGNFIETVLMVYEHGNTVCVSTQAGCKMGCSFCASTKNGFARSLFPSEILGQIETVIREHRKENEEFRISNIVLMGIGEPLDNYDNAVKFLRLVNSEKGLNIGYRHISLSTCGVVPGILKLAKEEMPITLSISLHAPNNTIRDSMMPINHKYKIEELLSACREYQKVCGRRISFEYAVIDSVNDSTDNAKELAKILRGIMCHVNLIPVNRIKERDYKNSAKNQLALFQKTLADCNVNATVRRKLGADINAACGQLRNKTVEKN